MSDDILGVSIGNTNCAAAIYKDEQFTVLLNENESKTTPTVVSFTDEEFLVGEAALDTQSAQEKAAKNTITKLKTFLGANYNDPKVQQAMIESKCTISQSDNHQCLFEIEFKKEKQKFASETVLSFILKYFKDIAASGKQISHIAISTPAQTDDDLIMCLYKAAKQADLKFVGNIPEPVACCYAYELFRPGGGSKMEMIFDFGGSSCSITILNVCGTQSKLIAHVENLELGGKNIDELLRDHILKNECQPFNKASIKEDAKERLLKECEQVKTSLSLGGQGVIKIPKFDGKENLKVKINHQDFSKLIKPIVQQCLDMVKKILADSNIKESSIDHVILSGGSSNLNDIQEMLISHFNRKDILLNSIDPSEVVAYGTTYGGAVMLNPNLLDMLSITSFDNSISIDYEICNPRSDDDDDDFTDSDQE